jgi:hypothetical protein
MHIPDWVTNPGSRYLEFAGIKKRPAFYQEARNLKSEKD